MLDSLAAGSADRTISVEALLARLGRHSSGILIFVLAMVALIPGGSVPAGLLISIPATQMLFSRAERPMTGYLRRRRVSVTRLSALTRRVVPSVRWLERFVKPRWTTPAIATRRCFGGVALALGLTLISPFPFSQIIPALVLMVMALAYLEEDGLVLALAGLAALISFGITGTTLWMGVEASGWIGNLLGRI